jgi:N-acetylmuramoyl-L-alanine amidase
MTARFMARSAHLWLAVFIAGPVETRAQSASTASSTVESAFVDASAQEAATRKALSVPSPPATVLKAVRTVVSAYEDVAENYPSSAYADDALWRGGKLSGDAFVVFGDPRERTVALRLFEALRLRYPSSRFLQDASSQKAAVQGTPARGTVSFEASKPVPKPMPTPSRVATIKDVKRSTIGDIVRVVIELDMEVAFRDQRIANPDRVFLDLPATRTVSTLKDQTLRFDVDAAPVRQVRFGRHPNQTTRVVLEAANVSSYSVYPLYSPYRLVIDCLRTMPDNAPVKVATPRSLPIPGSVPEPLARDPLAALPVGQLGSAVGLVPALRPGATAAIASALVESSTPAPLPLTAAAPDLPAQPQAPPSRNTAGGLSIARQLGLGVSRIVIDPGHGGHDSGAKGGGTTEADLVLDVALRLEKLLLKAPGTEVVLTRRHDEFVPLQERTAIANRESADLFLSIHANANPSPQAHGVETYFLNFATNLSAAAVAARENAASGQKMGALPDVVKSIALNSKLNESRDLATLVQRELVAKLQPANKTLRDLGVKQAPFVVLIGAAMPSVLAEVSFLTNPQDARLLKSPAYRQRIADALFDAVRRYQASLEAPSAIARQTRQ